MLSSKEEREARRREKREEPAQSRKRPKPIREGQIVCSANQAADAIDVANSTMWDYIARGIVESRKVRGRRFVVVASLRRLVGAEGE